MLWSEENRAHEEKCSNKRHTLLQRNERKIRRQNWLEWNLGCNQAVIRSRYFYTKNRALTKPDMKTSNKMSVENKSEHTYHRERLWKVEVVAIDLEFQCAALVSMSVDVMILLRSSHHKAKANSAKRRQS